MVIGIEIPAHLPLCVRDPIITAHNFNSIFLFPKNSYFMRTSIYFSVLLISALTIFGCTKDQSSSTPDKTLAPVDLVKAKQDVQKILNDIQAVHGTNTNVQMRAAGQFIVVPAGSVDAIAQAMKDAGISGVVYLRAGLHTENTRLLISSSTILIGEDGAILKVKSAPSVFDPNFVIPLNPAIHVLNAPNTAIGNISIQPIDQDGSTGILFENSAMSASMRNNFNNFQYSIIVEKSDNPVIIGNKIVASTLRTRGGVPFETGILVMNGSSAWVAQNEASGNFVGIFLCDKYGTATQNYVHDNTEGIVLCRILENMFTLPSGQLTGGLVTSSFWKINGNRSENNLVAGFTVINGSNGSILTNNPTTGNPVDFELKGNTFILGTPVKASFNNTVNATSTQKIHDCGNNDIITGGILDTATPCN